MILFLLFFSHYFSPFVFFHSLQLYGEIAKSQKRGISSEIPLSFLMTTN